MITKHHASLATIMYADIFDYPLTTWEFATWSIKRNGIVPKEAQKWREFVFLSGRENIVDIRRKREQNAPEKWEIAHSVARALRRIPTIQLVGVSGGLSMNNAKKEDDIDFFFITSSGSLWVSRLLATIAIELLGRRRKREAHDVKDKICLNMFMTESDLVIPKAERDLYSAHEVLQMTPLWERNRTYGKFLRSNAWVKYFLPNAWEQKTGSTIYDLRFKKKRSLASDFFKKTMKLLEPIARYVQLRYMKSHRTTEKVSDTVIRFHPKDARVWVKRELVRRLTTYHIPLDNIFYGR